METFKWTLCPFKGSKTFIPELGRVPQLPQNSSVGIGFVFFNIWRHFAPLSPAWFSGLASAGPHGAVLPSLEEQNLVTTEEFERKSCWYAGQPLLSPWLSWPSSVLPLLSFCVLSCHSLTVLTPLGSIMKDIRNHFLNSTISKLKVLTLHLKHKVLTVASQERPTATQKRIEDS